MIPNCALQNIRVTICTFFEVLAHFLNGGFSVKQRKISIIKPGMSNDIITRIFGISRGAGNYTAEFSTVLIKNYNLINILCTL